MMLKPEDLLSQFVCLEFSNLRKMLKLRNKRSLKFAKIDVAMKQLRRNIFSINLLCQLFIVITVVLYFSSCPVCSVPLFISLGLLLCFTKSNFQNLGRHGKSAQKMQEVSNHALKNLLAAGWSISLAPIESLSLK